MSDNIHKKCREIMAELGKNGEFEFWDEFKWLPKQKLEKRLKDLLESDVDEKYYLSNKMIDYLDRKPRAIPKGDITTEYSPCIVSVYHKTPTDGFYIKEPQLNQVGTLDIKGNDSIKRVYAADGISPTLTTMGGGNREPKIQVPSATSRGYEEATEGDSINLTHPNSTTRRGRVGKQVAQTLDCACNQAVVEKVNYRIRKLTTLECLRLQDFPDEFHANCVKAGLSNSQLYKQAGNSISVNVMEMIFNQIEKSRHGNTIEGSLF